MRKRKECSVAKGLGKPVVRTTSTRADKVLLNSGSVVHSRNDTWARLPPSVPVFAENVRSVSVSRKGRKLDRSRHEEVEVDEDVDRDESSESTGVQSRVTARGYFVERCRHERDSGYTRAQQCGYSGGLAMSTPPVTSAGVRASGGTARPGASVELSPSFPAGTRWIIALRLIWEGGQLTS